MLVISDQVSTRAKTSTTFDVTFAALGMPPQLVSLFVVLFENKLTSDEFKGMQFMEGHHDESDEVSSMHEDEDHKDEFSLQTPCPDRSPTAPLPLTPRPDSHAVAHVVQGDGDMAVGSPAATAPRNSLT